MKRRLASTGALAATIGIIALLGVGGGYALASGGGTANGCGQRSHSDKCMNNGTRSAPASAPAKTPATSGAYAHVLYNSGTGQATMVQTHGMGHATVMASGDGGFCFRHLPFTPNNATASIDWTHGTSEEDTAQVAIKSHGTAQSCPTGDPVRVETINANTGTEEHSAFYIQFN